MDQQVWSTGTMILTQVNRTTRRKTRPTATLFATNPTWTGLGRELGLHAARMMTNRLSRGMTVIDFLFPTSNTAALNLDLSRGP
jgi:hypothetical protein